MYNRIQTPGGNVTLKTQLFLHIGHPKTASSTIQAFLFKNWRMLEEAGYIMPAVDFQLANTDNPPGNVLWPLQKMREKKDVSPLLDWIDSCRNQKPDKKILLSSECLIQPEWPALFSKIEDHVEISLIYYVRRQDQLLLSAWRQWGLKRGLTLDEFLERRLSNKQPDFNQILNSWLEHANIAKTHARFIQTPFLNGQDVLEDLGVFLGLDTQSFEKVNNQNISIDARLLLFLSQHKNLFSSEHDEDIIDVLRDPDETEPKVRLQWNSDQFKRIQEIFEPLNQQFLRSYQSEKEGIPVIEPEFSLSGAMKKIAGPEQQIAYISERLAAAPNQDHPKLKELRRILQETHGVAHD